MSELPARDPEPESPSPPPPVPPPLLTDLGPLVSFDNAGEFCGPDGCGPGEEATEDGAGEN